MAWRTRNPQATIQWDQPKIVIGVLRDVLEVRIRDKTVRLYAFDSDGREETCWGATVLDQQINDADIGKKLRVEYLGKQTNPNTKREFNAYKVADWVSDGDVDSPPTVSEDVPF